MTKHPIPDAALDDRLAFVGTSGSGKTYAAGTAVERLLNKGARVVIVDPLDVWWGLRLLANGKTPSPYNVVIFGGTRGDLPLTDNAGALIGEVVARSAESAIVSLKHLGSTASEQKFMFGFLEAIYRKASGEPFHFIVDEADLFAPQSPGEKGLLPKIMNRLETIVRRGRVEGFIPWLISQRPAVLNKNVLSQADGLVAMKLTSTQDRNALDAWIKGQADEADGKAIKAELPTFPTGQAVVWLPSHGVLTRPHFPAKATFDSSRTPKRGETVRSASLKPIDLGALKARLASVEVEVAESDPSALRAKVAALNRQLAAKQASPTAAPVSQPDPRALRQAEDSGRRVGFEDGKRAGFADGFRSAQREAQLAVAGVKPPDPTLATIQARAPAPTQPKPIPPPVVRTGEPTDLPDGERACLIAIAQYKDGIRREQLQVLTGYKRSTRDAYILRLRNRGYVDQSGDRVNGSALKANWPSTWPGSKTATKHRRIRWARLGRSSLQVSITAFYRGSHLLLRSLPETAARTILPLPRT